MDTEEFFKLLLNSNSDFSDEVSKFVNFHFHRTDYGLLISSILKNILNNDIYQSYNNIFPRKTMKDIYKDIYDYIFRTTLDVENVKNTIDLAEQQTTSKRREEERQINNIDKEIYTLKTIFEKTERDLIIKINTAQDEITKAKNIFDLLERKKGKKGGSADASNIEDLQNKKYASDIKKWAEMEQEDRRKEVDRLKHAKGVKKRDAKKGNADIRSQKEAEVVVMEEKIKILEDIIREAEAKAEADVVKAEAEADKAKDTFIRSFDTQEKQEEYLKKLENELIIDKKRLKKEKELFNENITQMELNKKNIRSKQYESLDKLIKIDTINEFINNQDINTDLNLHLKYFDLIELFLLGTFEKFTTKQETDIIAHIERYSTNLTQIENMQESIKTALTNIFNIINENSDQSDSFYNKIKDINFNKLKVTAKIDTVSDKIELTNLKIYDYEILNNNIIEYNKEKYNYEVPNNTKMELVDLNCIHLLPIDLWATFDITKFKYRDSQNFSWPPPSQAPPSPSLEIWKKSKLK